MKFKFNLKNKEVSLEANVEGIVEKRLEQNRQKSDKKTAYQIRQEEKRKNEEMKHKHQMQMLFVLLGIVVLFAIVGIIASILGV